MTIDTVEKRKAGRPGITYKDVEAAATTLLAQNKSVTQQAIRDVFGSGSDSTIGPLLRQWKSSQPRPVATPIILPENLNAVILHEIEKRQAEAKEPLQKDLIDCEITIKSLESECIAITSERDSLLIDNSDLTTARDTYHGESNQKTLEIEELKKEVKREQERAFSAQTEAAKLSLKVDQLVETNGELKESNLELKSLLTISENAKNSAEKLADVNAAKLNGVEEKAKKLESEKSELALEIKSLSSNLNNAHKELNDSIVKYTGAQESLKSANKDIDRLTTDYQAAKNDVIAYQNKASELSGKLDLDQSRITDFEAKLDAAKLRISELESKLNVQ